MDNQNTQRSDDSITNNENNKTKPIIDNWMKKSEKHVYDDKEKLFKQLVEKTRESSPEKEVFRSRSSPNILPQNENNDDNDILTSRSEQPTPIDSQQTTRKEDNFSKYPGAKHLLDQAISLNESRNKQTSNSDSDSEFDGGKTRRRRSIKKNKKNSK